LLLLRLAAAGLRRLLARAAHTRNPLLRLALADLARPGAPTADVIAALGLGLTLITIVSLLDRTIAVQVEEALPKSAPSFFFVDIQPDEADRFDATIRRFVGARDYRRTPMIRGRITALNGIGAKEAKVAPESRWALAGDRGISYAAAKPDDAKIVDGSWWPSNYVGPTLISFDADLAKGMGLKPGSTMTLNVLGREIEGRIANLREVNFRNGRQNFILILSPGLIDKAPHSFLATVRVDPRDEEPLYRAVTDAFPNVSTVRVKDAIAAVDGLLQELAFGVRVAALFTIAGGLLVVAGAIAAGARARLYDATVLKVLGATRSFIAGAAAIKYGLLGILTGVFALALGTLAASVVSQDVLEVPLTFDFLSAALVIVGGGVLVLILGLIGSWQALAARPAKELRARS
jgi:putative ABC transport system permease protein